MEPLKEMFNLPFYRNFAEVLHNVYKPFGVDSFVTDVTKNLHQLELNQRLRNTSLILNKYLPEDFTKAVQIMQEAAPALQTGYTALVFPDYVGLFGKEHVHVSLKALKFFTAFGSSEFAIREFLKTDLTATITLMEKWAEDDNHHVRRLASEGSRPRLPWSFRLDAIIKDPSITTGILDKLKTDPHLYVRKSVANHLNDISKDNPAYMLNLVKSWPLQNERTAWIVKNACRTLIKKGHAGSLEIFSFEKNVSVDVSPLKLSAKKLNLGDSLTFQFTIDSTKKSNQKLVVDYAIIYPRNGGGASRKIFKLKEFILKPGEKLQLSKNQLFRNFSTRTHYNGLHTIEIMINGSTRATASFKLQVPSRKLSKSDS